MKIPKQQVVSDDPNGLVSPPPTFLPEVASSSSSGLPSYSSVIGDKSKPSRPFHTNINTNENSRNNGEKSSESDRDRSKINKISGIVGKNGDDSRNGEGELNICNQRATEPTDYTQESIRVNAIVNKDAITSPGRETKMEPPTIRIASKQSKGISDKDVLIDDNNTNVKAGEPLFQWWSNNGTNMSTGECNTQGSRAISNEEFLEFMNEEDTEISSILTGMRNTPDQLEKKFEANKTENNGINVEASKTGNNDIDNWGTVALNSKWGGLTYSEKEIDDNEEKDDADTTIAYWS